jgi:hypothetical protein
MGAKPMTNIGEFVKGTLVYLTNCFFAIILLLAKAWDPNRSAAQYLARRLSDPDRWPDGRVLLVLAIGAYQFFLFSVGTTHQDFASASGGVLLRGDLPPKVAIVATVLSFIAFEAIILFRPWVDATVAREPAHDATLQLVPTPNVNETTRCLLAIGILIIPLWGWFIFDMVEWLRTAYAHTLADGSTLSVLLGAATFIMVMVPVALFARILWANQALLPRTRGGYYIVGLLVTLLVAPVASGLLVGRFSPPPQPRLTEVSCAVNGDGTGTFTATAINDGAKEWKVSTDNLMVGFVNVDRDLDPRQAVYASIDPKLAAQMTLDRRIVVQPHQTKAIRLPIEKFEIGAISGAPVGCVLTNRIEPILVWEQVSPEEDRIGSVSVAPVPAQPKTPPPPPPE